MKPLIHASLFVGIGMFLFGVFYITTEAIAPVYPELKQRMKILEERKNEIEMITVGHSGNITIDFDVMGENGFHLWTESADLFETKYWAEFAVPRLPNLKVVFIASSYWQFRRDNTAGAPTVPTYFPEKRRELYAVTSSFRFLEGDLAGFVKGKMAPVIRVDHWKRVFETLFGKESKPLPVAKDGAIDYGHPERVSEEYLIADSRRMVAHDMMLQTAMVADRPTLVQDAYATLESIIEFLDAQDVQVVLFTPPYYSKYTELSDKKTADEMRTLMAQLDEKHENMVYYDFSTHPSFAPVSDYFFDSTHLSKTGARVFSAEFERILVADGILASH